MTIRIVVGGGEGAIIFLGPKITVNIDDGEINGNMPARALRLVLEWWELNKDTLMEFWNRAHSGIPLGTIDPLKDSDFFRRFTIPFNTVQWENGADFAPEYLYEISIPE